MIILTPYDFTRLKIDKNTALLRLLEAENKLIKKQMVKCYRIVTNNIKKIESLNKINEIELQQLQDYSDVRAREIHSLSEEFNTDSKSIDQVTEDIQRLTGEASDLWYKYTSCCSKLPDMFIVSDSKRYNAIEQ